MVHEQDDRWFQVLAGNAPAQDRDTRQAASLREYLVAEAQNTPPLDEAAQRRVMNLLEARGAFAAPTPPVQPKIPGLLDRLASWLLPDGSPLNGRFAGVAAALLAVMVLPFMLQSPGLDDDPFGIKGGSSAPSAVITSASPEQSAGMLVALLAKHGVVANLRSDSDSRWVQAHIPADRMAAVQADLLGMGLAANPQGDINVQFRLQR
ncbi:MAG: hypothetical protein KAY82_00210 [Hylemonella sp.]|jgi:hypothetical protein|nr:hypothetical protein [Hylemonella sp.]